MSGDDRDRTALARRLLRTIDRGALGTRLPDGTPYASLVLVASDSDGSPLLLLSDLAEHTRNLELDGRASLLLDGTAGHDDPLTGPRLTLIGAVAATGDARARARFLARHPSAAAYAGFGDFRLHRLSPACGHLVAGFGRIGWIDAGDLLIAPPPALAAAEGDILTHMNAEHPDALDRYARVLLGLSGDGWTITGIDRDGCDLRRGPAVARLEFPEPVCTPEAARRALVALAGEARQREGGT